MSPHNDKDFSFIVLNYLLWGFWMVFWLSSGQHLQTFPSCIIFSPTSGDNFFCLHPFFKSLAGLFRLLIGFLLLVTFLNVQFSSEEESGTGFLHYRLFPTCPISTSDLNEEEGDLGIIFVLQTTFFLFSKRLQAKRHKTWETVLTFRL